jgi:hypothetical protein
MTKREKFNADQISNLKRNLEEPMPQEEICDLACRLVDCAHYIDQLEADLKDNKLSRIDTECLRIGQQIQRAAGELPDLYFIEMEIERGSGDVILVDPEDNRFYFSDHSDGMSHSIMQAVDAALKQNGVKS